MWARNLLFAAVCLLGLGALAANILLQDRIATPRTFQPNRFGQPVVRNASASASSSAEPANTQATNDWQLALSKINAEFRESWEQKNLEVTPPADSLTLARRLSLGLTGTIPSLEEIRELERLPENERLEWWTSRLLEDRRFGDYVGERLARVYVGTDDGPVALYRRRRFVSWLSDQLLQAQPYNEIVQKMIGGNGIWTSKPELNFITHTCTENNQGQPDEVRLAARTVRAFLALRIDCLQCHDDNLGTNFLGDEGAARSSKQADFHQLAAFFAPAKLGLSGVQDTGDVYRFKYLKAEKEETVPVAVPYGADLLTGSGTRREQLAQWVTHPQNKPFARAMVNRMWAIVCGRPLVEPIDEIPLHGTYPPALETLADDFVQHGHDLQRLIRLIAASDAFQRASHADFEITADHEAAWAAFPLSRLQPQQMAGAMIQSSSLNTLDEQNAHIIWLLAKNDQTREFVRRYGDLGEDEFSDRGGTIPQRLLLMNGELVNERTSENIVANAATRIVTVTPRAESAIDAAYLAVLTRRATAEEKAVFVPRLEAARGDFRRRVLEDLYWVLVNSTEFSWNH
ncbi:hypothetical protein ETAA8_67390 [Anatilimnocola aggregata]|uniref:DUF1549 domain-containing protein n=1 Tax=Anatilimnocola aggregata TaxID=2528021 RepID=A0A517YMX7_9BACT|nr:DUF1553 domain-containing protein [Anatilimnocola aggregata]QDU31579.1 hypothetical protein ETAA8_67390 [Anatilimnocola aggregata]